MTELSETYKQFSNYLEKHEESSETSQKLKCIMSDEMIVSHLISNEVEDAKELASKTMELCDQFEHPEGRKLREAVLTGSPKDAFLFARQFVLDNIWIPIIE